MKTQTYVVALLLACMFRTVPCDAHDPHFYAGIAGGLALGQATFRSMTKDECHIGLCGSAFCGYEVSRHLAVEAGMALGRQTQTALDCDPYWLSSYGERYFSPVIDEQGHYYRDLRARTTWGRFAVQASIDLLSFVTPSTCRWSLSVAPQVSAVITRTRHLSDGYDHAFSSQCHLGLGGQAAVGFRVNTHIGLQLYGGITCLTGKQFDNIPRHHHKSNQIYEGGLRVAYHFIK